MEEANKVFNNLRDQYKHLGLPTDLIDEYTDFTIFNLKDAMHQMLPFKSPVHRLNFFVFVFIKNGFGEYTVDEQKVSL